MLMTACTEGERAGEPTELAEANCKGDPTHTYTIQSAGGHTEPNKQLKLYIDGDKWCLKNKAEQGKLLEAKGSMHNRAAKGTWVLTSNDADAEGGKHVLVMFAINDWSDLILNFIAIPVINEAGEVETFAHNGQSHGTKD